MKISDLLIVAGSLEYNQYPEAARKVREAAAELEAARKELATLRPACAAWKAAWWGMRTSLGESQWREYYRGVADARANNVYAEKKA